MKQLVLDIAPPPQPTLENFATGPNAEVLAALRALLTGDSHERFIYLWGGAGCGKSHLLQAVASAAAGHHLRPCMASATQMCSEDEAAQCDILLVNDVLKLDAPGQSRLFNMMNRMRRQDLASRLAQCLIFQVKCLSDEDKVQALTLHAQNRGFTLPRDVAAYLLKTWKRDLPALLAVLDALDRYSLETKRSITVPLAREVLALLPKT
jgi:DnaA family protein